jgi:hypothetical protein
MTIILMDYALYYDVIHIIYYKIKQISLTSDLTKIDFITLVERVRIMHAM